MFSLIVGVETISWLWPICIRTTPILKEGELNSHFSGLLLCLIYIITALSLEGILLSYRYHHLEIRLRYSIIHLSIHA